MSTAIDSTNRSGSGTHNVYIYLIRQFPDIDHMAPIIYKMAQKGKNHSEILCQNLDYDIQNDFILNKLKEKFGINTRYSYDVFYGSSIKHLFSKLLLSVRNFSPRIGNSLFVRLHPMIYDKKWAENLLTHLKASALILDFHKASKFSTRVLTEAANKNQVPVVLVTHGVTMRLTGLESLKKIPLADYKIFPNGAKVEYYKTSRDSNQTIKILGSPRYCDEWEPIYNGLLKETFSCPDLPDEKGKLKVLFFERLRIGFYGDHDSVREVGKLDFVNVVFKGKVRIKSRYDKILGSKYPSARLIQWADVVVMSISSIALEILWQNKILIYLKYLAPDDVCVFDKYGACWPVNSQSELIDALRTIRENPEHRPYPKENVERLFKDVVYAGDRSRDVLNDYADFLVNLNV